MRTHSTTRHGTLYDDVTAKKKQRQRPAKEFQQLKPNDQVKHNSKPSIFTFVITHNLSKHCDKVIHTIIDKKKHYLIKRTMIGGVKTIDCNDVNPDLLMLDSYNSCDGGIKTEPGMMYAGGKTYITLDNKGWQGSTTTILEERTLPVAVCEDFNSSYSQHSDSNSNSRPETPVTGVRGRRPGRKAAKAAELEEEQGSPEEQERLRIRRERNKEAAARCRKRKMDQIETLEQQVGFSFLLFIKN